MSRQIPAFGGPAGFSSPHSEGRRGSAPRIRGVGELSAPRNSRGPVGVGSPHSSGPVRGSAPRIHGVGERQLPAFARPAGLSSPHSRGRRGSAPRIRGVGEASAPRIREAGGRQLPAFARPMIAQLPAFERAGERQLPAFAAPVGENRLPAFAGPVSVSFPHSRDRRGSAFPHSRATNAASASASPCKRPDRAAISSGVRRCSATSYGEVTILDHGARLQVVCEAQDQFGTDFKIVKTWTNDEHILQICSSWPKCARRTATPALGRIGYRARNGRSGHAKAYAAGARHPFLPRRQSDDPPDSDPESTRLPRDITFIYCGISVTSK